MTKTQTTNIFIKTNISEDKGKFYHKTRNGSFKIHGVSQLKVLDGVDEDFVSELIEEYKSLDLDTTEEYLQICKFKSKLEADRIKLIGIATKGLAIAEETKSVDEEYPRITVDELENNTNYIELKNINGTDIPVSTKIANFILTVNSRSKDIDTGIEFFTITMNNGKRIKTVDIEVSKFGTLNNAERNLFNADYIFMGTPSQYRVYIDKIVSNTEVSENFLVSQAGMHIHPVSKEYIWVASNGAFDKNGQLLDDIKLIDADIQTSSALIPKNWNRKVDVDVFYQFNKSSIVIPYLGYTVATLYKQRFYNALYEKTFPILWSIGKSSSGKSSTVKIIKNILKMKHENNLNMLQVTPFALAKHLHRTKNLPIILDENKPSQDWEKKKWLSIVNTLYNADVITKGQKDMSTVEFKNDASVITLGEFTYGDTSTLERCIIVDANRDMATTEAHLEGYKAMTKSDYGWVGETMLWDALNISDEELIALYNETRAYFLEQNPDINDRPLHNYSLLGVALQRLGLLCGVNESVVKSLDVLSKLIETDVEDVKTDDSIRDGLAGKMLRDIWEMKSIIPGSENNYIRYVYQNHIIDDLHYKISSDGEVSLNISAIMPIYQAWCKSNGTSNSITPKDLYKQICHNPHYIAHNKVVKMGGKCQKCLQMRIEFFESVPEICKNDNSGGEKPTGARVRPQNQQTNLIYLQPHRML
jgi:hypothetical protein